jgi:hypothetical protein
VLLAKPAQLLAHAAQEATAAGAAGVGRSLGRHPAERHFSQNARASLNAAGGEDGVALGAGETHFDAGAEGCRKGAEIGGDVPDRIRVGRHCIYF